ncbi:MAG: hypothetical protein ACM3S1_00765 [Hyphomicrobiales bacterium]
MVPRKLVETAFRNALLMIAVVLFVPLAVLGLSTDAPKYQSQGILWVNEPPDPSLLIGHSDPYRTPAQNQALALGDLLSTRSFKELVAEKAGIVPPGADEATKRAVAAHLTVWATASGQNLLTVGAISYSPESARNLVQAVIDEYATRASETNEQTLQASIEYYQQQVGLAQQELEARQAALTQYVQANPRIADPKLDIQYQTLQTRVESQQVIVENLSNKLQDLQLRIASAEGGQASVLTVQDPPNQPGRPMPTSMTSRFGLPFAGLVFGLLVALTYLYVRFRSDHTIVSAEDLADVGVPLLGSVPELRPGNFAYRIPLLGAALRMRQRGFARSTARVIGAVPAAEEVA